MSRYHLRLCLKLTVLIALSQSYQLKASNDGSGLSTAIAADLVGAFNLSKEDGGAKDSFDVRETEISFYAPIDHLFEGILSIAAHREGGEALYEVHEASISTSKLVSGLSFKLGQYFLGIGRLNRFHRHDWPFVSAPKVTNEFFGSEGVLDSGAEASYLFPSSVYINLTAGVTNGWTYGHSHNEGKKPKIPTHYARLSSFFEPADLGLATGLSYLSRTSAEEEKLQLIGFDGVAKIQSGSFPRFLLQTEAWHREVTPKTGDKSQSAGTYVYPQYGFSKSLSAGCRFDYFTVLSLKDANGSKIANSQYGFVPTLTYKSSEFASFRLAINHETTTQKNQDTTKKQYAELQSIFILGAHPAHDF
ncbi:MAG: hypothetical protein HRU09_07725 [Oligoflexales bacterium]|nr:hypothetical protein [Oligoflexales bacterium]